MKHAIRTALSLGLALMVLVGARSVDEKAAPKLQTAEAAATVDQDVLEAQAPFYPLNTCLVSGEPMDPANVENVVHEGRLVRFCCGRCAKKFGSEPAAFLAKLDQAAIRAQKPSYPFEECLVSDEALGSMGDPIELVHEGRLARLCCKGCVKSFKKDPATHFANVDRAMMAKQLPTYALKTCPVSGEPLGDAPTDFMYGTQLVRTCCKRCKGAVEKEPAKYLAAVKAAAK